MNVDAACFSAQVITGIGAALRDHEGRVIAAFTIKLPTLYDPTVAEALAVRESLRSLKTLGMQADVIETDSQVVARAINSEILVSVIEYLVFDNKSLFSELGGGTCHFVPRKSNEVAHMLARESVTFANNMTWLYECPSCILHCITSGA